MSTPTLVVVVISTMFIVLIGACLIADRRNAKRRNKR